MMTEKDHLPTLPEGWAWTSLGSVISRISNGLTQRQSKVATGVPVTRIETISYGRIDLSRVRYLSGLPQETIDRYKLLCGDILFSHINSDQHLGKTAIFCLDNITLLHGMNLLLIRSNRELMMPELLKYLCDHYRSSGVFVSIAQHAVNQSSINQTKLSALPIPLPPLPEQHRIVAKIEELFTRLDAGVEALKKIKAQLKRYRQAVLKHAFEGQLTAKWREAHQHELEPTSVLLERIKQEHRKTGNGKYKEVPLLDTSDLPNLPEGWVWTRLGIIAEINPKLTIEHLMEDAEVTFLPMRCVEELTGQVDASLTRRLSEVRRGYTPFARGDLLFAKITPCMENGKVAIAPDLTNEIGFGSTEFHVIRLPESFPRKLLFYFLVREDLRKDAQRNMTGTAGQLRVPVSYMQGLAIPLPPIVEQHRIVEEIERRFSVADQIERTVDQGLKQAERLRQSILKRAFEGKLVPQDPSDEHAEKLLERIREERAKQLTEKRVTVSRVKRKRSTEGN